MSHAFTLGVEEEFQIVDPTTWELRSHVSELLASSAPALGDQIKREMHQSIVEVGTRICADVGELRGEIFRTRRELVDAAERVGLASPRPARTPSRTGRTRSSRPATATSSIVEELQQLARSLLIFGLHVHVAVPDRTTMIDLMNEARYFLPHLLALSTSSPFWMGRDTGLKSYRTTIFRRFPRTGDPRPFRFVERVRELRAAAGRAALHRRRQEDLVGRAAASDLRHAGVPHLRRADARRSRRHAWRRWSRRSSSSCTGCASSNLGFRLYRRALIEENKWRAARWGIDGKLIDFGKRREVPMRDLALELLEFIDDVVDDLGSRRAVEYVHTILREGTSADRQLAVYRATGDLRAVVQDDRRARRESAEQSAEVDAAGGSGERLRQTVTTDEGRSARAGASTAFRRRSSSGSTQLGARARDHAPSS